DTHRYHVTATHAPLDPDFSAVLSHDAPPAVTNISFPTRRSSDLHHLAGSAQALARAAEEDRAAPRARADRAGLRQRRADLRGDLDRKSTRLNSSHVAISYAVFCLQKKTSPAPPLITRRSTRIPAP